LFLVKLAKGGKRDSCAAILRALARHAFCLSSNPTVRRPLVGEAGDGGDVVGVVVGTVVVVDDDAPDDDVLALLPQPPATRDSPAAAKAPRNNALM
jgi:hypothetical protein